MCKWLRNILFPTNILNKHVQSFEFEQVHPPYNSYTYEIDWTGERLEFNYYMNTRSGGKVVHTPKQIIFTDGNESGEQIFIRQSLAPVVFVSNLYLKCTNVTSLVVNGETLI